MCIGRIAECQSENFGRWAVLLEHLDKIAVFGNDDGRRCASGVKDVLIGRVSVAEKLYGVSLDCKGFGEPRCQGG